ncbi:hypothetical protein [Kribbella sp.]|uniref:hypothetical protein n=1 Tax=Kribbella sp. TaxID=1871183 RepID=UPI002D6C16CD|nr:hypothetical protein [Kribbella sp.]HZX05670.1 hypothetical protein [Kribbella sp.]
MSAERVVVTRTEMRQVLDGLNACIAIIQSVLDRPVPRPVETDAKGWPILPDPEDKP